MPDVTYPGVYIEELHTGIHQIAGVDTSICAFIGVANQGPLNQPLTLYSTSDYVAAFGAVSPDAPMSLAVQLFFDNGGNHAIAVRIGPADAPKIAVDETGIIGNPDTSQGLYAFDSIDQINLLCIPPLILGQDISASTWAAAAQYCTQRHAILLIDAPHGWTADPANVLASMQAGAAQLRDAIGADGGNAALYFPDLRLVDPTDPTGQHLLDMPPSGAIAGVIARVDSERGIWKAPAGSHTVITGIADLSYLMTDGQNSILNPLAINCLRRFPGYGTVIWGARTLLGTDRSASEWQYLPVRRLALFVEASIARGIDWAAFEANDERLWAAIRQAVGGFLETLFRQGALQGTTAEDAYFVKCDRSTMTQQDIDTGALIVVIGIAPVKPAEFVIISLHQITAHTCLTCP
jgi:hypothetical protein